MMRVPCLALLILTVVACTEGKTLASNAGDADVVDDGGNRNPGDNGADGSAVACDYRPKDAPAWTATIDPAPYGGCGPRRLDLLRCSVIGSDGDKTLALQCVDEDDAAYRVAFALEKPLAGLPFVESDSWSVTYRPDIRGDNGNCPYSMGTFVIRELETERLVLALVDSNEAQQNLSRLLGPLAVDISDDDCAAEVTNTCFGGEEDKRQALAISIGVDGSQRTLRAGEDAILTHFQIDVQRAIDDRGHPCCWDCGSGASSLAFSVRNIE